MNASSREKGDFRAKEERDRDQDRPSLVPSSSRRWSAFINPRIVRVSRTFGGKDRHSKVCTVRGLRDRRIRLSVPTAVQLYDLQDKLGVSQPSKVIDWLIDAAKHEIDKLPPLQMPPGFSGFPLISPELVDGSSKSAININGNTEIEDAKSRSQNGDAIDLMRTKGKEVESRESHLEKAKFVGPNVPAGVNFFPLPNLSSHNLSLAHQLRSQYGLMLQSDQGPFTNDNSDNIASSLSLASNAHHSPSYFSPTTPIMPHSFPPYNNATPHPLAVENNLQLFSSDHSFMPSLHLSGSSTLRSTIGEYVQFLRPENKTGHPPSM